MSPPYTFPPRPYLVQTTAPYPTESWPSLVVRLGQCNQYDPITSVGTLIQTILSRHNLRDDAWWPSTTASMEILATLSHNALRDVQNTLFPTTVAVYPRTHAQYCPACLAVAPFHRRMWMAQLVAACVEHGCFLLHQCSACTQPVSVADVLRATCSRCKTTLTDARAFGIEDRQSLDAQQVVQAILSQTLQAYTDHSLIPNVSDEALIVLIHRFAKMVHFATDQQFLSRFNIEQQWMAHQWPVNAPHERLRVTTQVVQMLHHWPTRFYTFLDQQYSRHSLGWGIESDKEAPCVDLALRAPVPQLIREAYHTYLGNTYIPQQYTNTLWEQGILTYGLSIYANRAPALARPRSFMTLELAAHHLRVTPPVILHLVRVYAIPFYELYPRVFVLQEAIDTMKQTWNALLTLAEAADWFGLSASSVEEMTQREVLSAVYVPGCTNHHQLMYRKHDVARWIELVWAALGFVARRNIGCPEYLTSAVDTLAHFGITETSVLLKLVAGELPGFIDAHHAPEFQNISFSSWDLDMWIWELHTELATQNDWVSVPYFAQWLNEQPQSVLPEIHSWIDAGVLRVVKEVDGRLYFARVDAEHFIRTYTYPLQVATILNVSEQDVLNLIAQGSLPTVPCVRAPVYHRHLLVRADVERLHAYLKSGLNVSYSSGRKRIQTSRA